MLPSYINPPPSELSVQHVSPSVPLGRTDTTRVASFLVVNPSGPRKWIKTGIEFENDQTNVSTVATDNWSDWSLLPLPGTSEATIEIEVMQDNSLWVKLLSKGGKATPLREVTWWADLPKDAECWVGVGAAKPAPHGEKEDLVVHFEDLKIELK